MFTLRKAAVVGVGAALALTVSSGIATAEAKAPVHKLVLNAGTTSLAVASSTGKALAANGIKVSPASEARVTKRGISFPITGGTLNAKTLAGAINHAGGLTFSKGKTVLTVRGFTASTVTGHLSGYVDQLKTRIRILDLNLKSIKVFSSSKIVRVLGIKATLNKDAAAGLNAVFGTKLFKAGLPIGTARVDARYTAVTVG